MYGKEYKSYLLKERGTIRKTIRKIYLNHILKYVKDKAIDFGCGAGELLSELAPGSTGFDVNPEIVEYCVNNKLDVRLYDPAPDRYHFNDCRINEYKTFIVSHVLEHLEKPDIAFEAILQSCERLGIKRIIAVVPGEKGFFFDKTHKTFIDNKFFEKENKYNYKITDLHYFPINTKIAGKFYTHNEMIVIYDKV